MSDATEDIVARAVDWALQQVGSNEYRLRCLAFVEDAYEVANGIEVFGGSTAKESAEPRYVGWAPPDVILRGSRRRQAAPEAASPSGRAS